MKLSVTKGFIDKDTMIFHNVGAVVEYPEARAKEIEYKGYGKILEPKPTKAESKEAKESKEVKETRRSSRELEQPKRETRRR